MLKKALCLLLLFSIFVLSSPISLKKNIEITNGKNSNCIVQNVYLATFYDSVCITKEKDFNYQNLIKNTGAKLQFVEEAGEIISFYYYSKKIPKCQTINGVKVNLHVAVAKNYIKIGCPLIYGGY